MHLSLPLLALGASLVAAVPSLEVKGNAFVNPKTGDRFQIVGMAYQPGGSAGYQPDKKKDPLSDKDHCLRDAALMQILGVNTIRVYNLDPNLNHDACASIFNAAGMYMLIDVNSPLVGESISSWEPWTSYYAAYLNRTFAIVEAFKSYPNLLGFFSGNEVISAEKDAEFVPRYIRAVTRDLKNYIAKHADRAIPVGYSAADVRDVLMDSFNFFTCAENGDATDPSRGDMFALNSYSWCGNSDFTKSQYDQLVKNFTGTSVPVFFSEYGCNEVKPRVFTEVGALYSDKMTPVLSGGVVYEFAQEPNNYGLVDIHDDGSADILADFYTLKNQYAKIDSKTIQATKPSSSSPKPPTCDSKLIKEAGFDKNFTIPVLPPGAKEIIDNGVKPAPVGKIIKIDDYTVKYKVKNPDGTELKGLAVKPLADDQSNTPGSNSPSGTSGNGNGSSTGSSSSPTQSKKNAALGKREMAASGVGILALTAAAFFGLLI